VVNRPLGPAARQLATVAFCLCSVLIVTGIPAVREAVPADQAMIVLALAAMAVGVVCALFAALLGRLIDDERSVWIGVALAVYSLVAVPASALGLTKGGLAALAEVRFAAHAYVVAVLCVAVLRPELRQRCGGRKALMVGLLWVVALGLVGLLLPAVGDAIVGSLPVRISIASVGVLAGLSFAAVGWFTHTRAHSWMGLGCMVIALAHVEKLTPGLADGHTEATFSTIRLLGMTLVMVGLGDLSSRVLRSVAQVSSSQEEELRQARLHLRRMAEQGHELRNGLAGLAGATGLLVAGADESEVLRAAVASELARLGALLGPPGVEAATRSEVARYEVATVLAEQVALRRSAGMDVRSDAELGLVAIGSRSMLAQVLTNLLANCAAHAPGSPVRVQAGRQGKTVFVRVSDFGPGVPVGAERTVFEPGARGELSPGQGLGLSICDRLVHAEGGTIVIRSHRGGAEGCTVLLRIPAAEPAERRPTVAVLAEA
jgi:two-component system OmpR family sensor kinase